MSSIAHALVSCKISALSGSYLQMSGPDLRILASYGTIQKNVTVSLWGIQIAQT